MKSLKNSLHVLVKCSYLRLLRLLWTFSLYTALNGKSLFVQSKNVYGKYSSHWKQKKQQEKKCCFPLSNNLLLFFSSPPPFFFKYLLLFEHRQQFIVHLEPKILCKINYSRKILTDFLLIADSLVLIANTKLWQLDLLGKTWHTYVKGHFKYQNIEYVAFPSSIWKVPGS